MSLNEYTWGLRGYQIRAAGGVGQHVATYMTNRDDGLLLAAAPRMLALLLDACETFDSMERCSRSCSTADAIRRELAVLAPKHYAALEAANGEQHEQSMATGAGVVRVTAEAAPKVTPTPGVPIDALVAAVQGDYPEAPEIGPLSWLKSAVDELKKRGPADDDDDPSAYWEMVAELESFGSRARAALPKVPL